VEGKLTSTGAAYFNGMVVPLINTITIQRRVSLRSSAQAELLVHRTRTAIRQCPAFSVAGPTAWHDFPVALHLTPLAHSAIFISSHKTTLFDRGWAGSAPE